MPQPKQPHRLGKRDMRKPVVKGPARDWSLAPAERDFLDWLDETLIPDLRDSGMIETAADFEKLINLVDVLSGKLFVLAQSCERDRREPDKIFAHVTLSGGASTAMPGGPSAV